MQIQKQEDFLSTTKDKHILLDTNVFIDAFLNPIEFGNLFNELRENESTLVTIEPVKFEFLKGAPNKEKFQEKLEFLEKIVTTYLPADQEIHKNIQVIISKYGEAGKPVSITDFFLGGYLMKYNPNLLLLTKDISDFSSSIFKPLTYLHLVHKKGIHLYTIYQYVESQ